MFVILFIPSGEFLLKYTNSISHFLFTKEETKDRPEFKFEVATFKSIKDALAVFELEYWGVENSSYIEFESKLYYFREENKPLFEIMEMSSV